MVDVCHGFCAPHQTGCVGNALARCWAGDVVGCFVDAMAKSQMSKRGLAGAVHGTWATGA